MLAFISYPLSFFFTAKHLNPKLDFPEAVVIKQQEFIKLIGFSSVAVNELRPEFKSFVVNAPQALSLSTIRPYPSDVRHLLSLAAATEVVLILMFVLVFLFLRTNRTGLTPFLLFCLFFSFGVLFMIGYSVNNLGAIVRYRSIIFPLLLAPIAAKIDWYRVNRLFTGNIKL